MDLVTGFYLGVKMVRLREYIRLIVISVRYYYLTKIYGMKIANSARISFGAFLDKTNPKGINIGSETYFAAGARILSHDYSKAIKVETVVGERCFIGTNAIIMAGVKIGDQVIVGAGSVVTKDVPSNSIVVGNPAKIIRKSIHTGKFGQLKEHPE